MQSAECRVKGALVGAIHESPENKRLPYIKAKFACILPKTNAYHKANNQQGIPRTGRPISGRLVWSVKVYTLFSFIRHSVFSSIRLQFSSKNDIMSIEKKHV